MNTLEEICFSHIVDNLEQFTTDELAMLPVKFRKRLLLTLPLVDVCRLEDSTMFTDGLDMEEIWEQIYKNCSFGLMPLQLSQEVNWREEIFECISLMVLECKRPYGYFFTYSDRHQSKCLTENSMVNHPPDRVNYLVAMRRRNRTCVIVHVHVRGRKYVVATHHEVMLAKGIVSPGKRYNVVCQTKQFIPNRYRALFPAGSEYLPDYTALQLICSKCHFHPSEVRFSILHLNTFFLSIEQEGSNPTSLNEFFKNVESLTIHKEILHKQENIHKTIVPKNDLPSKLLSIILSNPCSKLASLNITGLHTSTIDLSVASILASSYNTLKSILLYSIEETFFDLQLLIPMTKCQSLLHTISLTFYGPTPKFSDLHPWLLVCFELPFLQHLTLQLKQTTSEFLFKTLILFLSTSCSQEQTLTLGTHNPETSSDKTEIPFSLTNKPLNTIDIPNTCQINDTTTLKYKCVEFCDCNLNRPTFIGPLLTLKSLKLRRLCIDRNSGILFFKQVILHSFFDVQLLKITHMNLQRITACDFNTLLHKKSLKKVSLDKCFESTSYEFFQLGEWNGYNVEESVQGNVLLKTKDVSYTITRKQLIC